MSSDAPYKIYTGESRKTQKKLAKYGPAAIENEAFQFVEGIVRENNLDLSEKRKHWFETLENAIQAADGGLLRKVADAAEAVGRVKQGILYDSKMLAILESLEAPESWHARPDTMRLWGEDLAPYKRDFLNKFYGRVDDAAKRDLRHRLEALGVQLNDAKPGRRSTGVLRVQSSNARKRGSKASSKKSST